MSVDEVVEVSGVDDVVLVFRVGVDHGDVGFDVAFFDGFHLGDVECAVALLCGVLFDEVVPERVLQGAVLLVGGEDAVEDDAVLRSDVLRGGHVAENQCHEGEEECFFHVVFVSLG